MCIRDSAYWALFWANGKGGGWTYASSGAGSLSVPAGGWVALKFQTSSSRSYPGVNPYTPPPVPKPKPKPKPVTKPTASASAPAGASASPKPKPKPKPSASASAKPSASASASASAQSESAADPTNAAATTDSDGGSQAMVWVAGALAALLIDGMGPVSYTHLTLPTIYPR